MLRPVAQPVFHLVEEYFSNEIFIGSVLFGLGMAVFFDFIAGYLDIASKAGLKDSIKKSGKGTNHNQDFKANDKVNDDRTV